MTSASEHGGSADGILHALALLLTDPEVHHAFVTGQCPDLDGLDLGESDRARILALDRRAIAAFSVDLREKRLNLAAGYFPATVRALELLELRTGVRDLLFASGHRLHLPAPGAYRAEEVRAFNEVVRSAELERPDWLIDLADYEVARAMIVLDDGTASPHTSPCSGPELSDRATLIATAVELTAMLRSLDAGTLPDGEATGPHRYALVVTEEGKDQLHRLGAAAYGVLNNCDGSTPVPRIADSLGIDENRTAELIDAARRAGVVAS